ncbi:MULTISPECIES: GspE/PulE family protein [unclassified Leucobacter]|uniref:GspE/PulE family protein n=1 Tax=unclassified Leucobacter TaxID=2621730 RepID=UPI00165E124F|nr:MULTISPECIES: GspE/PulE family protein [unclassified Leucobacter]MBC9925928.1 type II/IV secretion system protein [Leucobacter sp. cx-169]
MRRSLEHLVLTSAVPRSTVDALIAEVGERRVENELVARGHLTNEQVALAIAVSAGLPFVDLANATVDRDAVLLLAPELCRRHQVLGIQANTRRITVAVVDPDDVIALDDISSSIGLAVQVVVAARDAMATALDRYVRLDDQIADLTTALDNEASNALTVNSTESLEDDGDDAPIVRFVNLIISQAIQDRASDIHIDPGDRSLRVRYRIDGVLHDTQEASPAIKDGVISRLKIMSGIDIAEKRRPQDGRISVTHNGRSIDLRVATLPTVWGEKIVMRILDNSAATLSIKDLGMSAHNLDEYSRSFTRPHGMILVTGPTGSGKSTTLYTTLSEIARPEINVITIEDPVEYRMEGIAQMQVNPRAGLTFASALRSILRGDPDVVLVGEIRDGETAQTSVEAALTGHLVLSTLHTNDAPSAITRLIEMGIEPFLVASAIDSVVAQRLARRLCVECRVMKPADPVLLGELGFSAPEGARIGEPVGCARCAGTGYRGRVALHEVMVISETIERHAVARSSGLEIRKSALAEGMIPLREDGWQKVLKGITSIEEVLRVAA